MNNQKTKCKEQPVRSPQECGTAVLEIDLGAVASNYAQLGSIANGAECAAVVKADAYGLGTIPIAKQLAALGCSSFFVATPEEGAALRAELADPDIFVLDGLLDGSEALYYSNQLIPVIGSLETLERWLQFGATLSVPPATAVHIDTGMNRLGIGDDEISNFINNSNTYFNHLNMRLVISHLACGDEPEHPRNRMQLDRFRAVIAKLPPVRASLANSAGILLGPDYHFDLVRPGIALYGGRAVNGRPNQMKSVVNLHSRIVQVRTIAAGDSVGYGAAFVAQRKTRIATVPIGYADGYFRALGSTTDSRGAHVLINGRLAPVAGRVSMDLITVDVTDLPADMAISGAPVEIIGPQNTVDDLAEVSGTIGYEILATLGRRYHRRYVGA